MSRRKRRSATVLLVLFLLLVPPTWIVYREMRQARLDHALIEAIKSGDDKKALAALSEGASGEARDTGEPPTFREVLQQMWDHVQHPGESFGDRIAPTALALLFGTPQDHLTYEKPGPNLAVVRALLDHGAQVKDRDGYGNSLLADACMYSTIDAVYLLLQRGADVNEKSNNGDTPIFDADAECTEVLLKHGAKMEVRNVDQQTPLISAVLHERPDVVRILLEHGAQVSATDADGDTALSASRYGRYSPTVKIAALLRKYGAK